jgi:hypothetical protein
MLKASLKEPQTANRKPPIFKNKRGEAIAKKK